jgi:hypothetical protein
VKIRAVIFALLMSSVAIASDLPRTVAETSNYTSTSRYEDVRAFISAIQSIDANVRVETFATTNEGRALPLVIVGPPGISDPRSAAASGLPVVFIMANIHAGEVEGKEATLMLLRDLISSPQRAKMIVLIAPIYNADGNERISTDHRRTQHGPPNGVGIRENAQGLDLNRDYMKLTSPEARGLVQNVLVRWDPLLTVDCHTTNGSYHGYQLTYAPMLNPNADAKLIAFSREQLLPQIRERMKKRYGKDTYYYGNFVDQLTPEKGWYSFDSRPRFGNNYVGLRNRFVILSEAYSYIDFRARVEVTYEFLQAILRAVEEHGAAMQDLVTRADAKTRSGKIAEGGVRFRIATWKKKVTILWERSVAAPEGKADPEISKAAIVHNGEIVPVAMTDFGIFEATETSAMPFAYVLDANEREAVANLRTHGIVVETLDAATPLAVDEFVVLNVAHSDREFQHLHETTLTGEWQHTDVKLAAGSYIIRMQQPLARLAFYLLEPRSDDGLFNWNVLEAAKVAPVRKIAKPVPLRATVSAE